MTQCAVMSSALTRLTRPPHDEGDDGLAPSLVRSADHCRFQHGRMARQRILDFARIDVLAAGNDHVLEAVDDIDEAGFVDLADIAGVQKAVRDSVSRVAASFCQ